MSLSRKPEARQSDQRGVVWFALIAWLELGEHLAEKIEPCDRPLEAGAKFLNAANAV